MITCPKCGRENKETYTFCLGCGAELRQKGAPKKEAPATPGIGPTSPNIGLAAAHADTPHVADEPTNMGTGPVDGSLAEGEASAEASCPQCGHINSTANKFCASCGFKLGKSASVAVPAPQAASGVVLTALRADGTEAGTYPLPAGTVTLGRNTGSIFAGDSYLSPRHATFTPRNGKLFVRDEGSLNGIYKKLRPDEPVALRPNDVFRIGQEIVRFEPLSPLPPADGVERLGSPSRGYVGRLALLIGRDVTGNAYPVPESGIHLGRERGEVLFPEDGYVSGLHCRIAVSPSGDVSMTDLGSSNGSFIRLQQETEVHNGDILLMGQQLFRIAMS